MTDHSSFLGHAAVLAEVGGLRIGFDVHKGGDLLCGQWRFVPEPIHVDPASLDVLVISHAHADHFDARVIHGLRDGAIIIIPDERPQLQAMVAKAFASVGRHDDAEEVCVQVWPHGQRVHLGHGVVLACVPSDRNQIDSAWFLQSTTGYGLYHGNDAFMTRTTLKRLRRQWAPDGVTDCYAPFCFIHWYPMCVESLTPERRRAELARCVDESLASFREHGEVLGARCLIPCGGNLAFMGESQEMSDAVLTPWEAMATVGDGPFGPWPAIGNGEVPVHLGPQARDLINAARAQRRSVMPSGAFDDPSGRKPLWSGHGAALPSDESIGRMDTTSDRAGVRLNYGDTNGLGPMLDIYDDASGDRLRFVFDVPVWNAWTSGAISFEDALGTCAFKVRRTPEHYNRDLWQRLRRWL
jgi:hypothetical protein